MATQIWEIGLVIFSTFFNGSGPIFFKLGMNKLKKFSIIKFITNKFLILGIVFYGLSYVISIPAFKGGDVSVLYPFISLAYIWAALFSVKFLKENMNAVKWIGIFIIILGVSFIGFGR